MREKRFSLQKKLKKESEQKILKALWDREQTFTELLKATKLSRQALSRHLKELRKNKFIRRIIDEEKNKILYELPSPLKTREDMRRILIWKLWPKVFNVGEDKIFLKIGDKELTDKEFLKSFTRKIGVLASFSFLKAMSDPEKAEYWIKTAFAPASHKLSWFFMLAERAVYGSKTLWDLDLKEITEEIEKHGWSPPERLLPQILMKIPKERIKEMQDALRELYPYETKLLEEIVSGEHLKETEKREIS